LRSVALDSTFRRALPCPERRNEGGGDVASKDKGGGKTSKKPAQHDLKAKRKAKKEKRAAK
jgi:hypothetical protein